MQGKDSRIYGGRSGSTALLPVISCSHRTVSELSIISALALPELECRPRSVNAKGELLGSFDCDVRILVSLFRL